MKKLFLRMSIFVLACSVVTLAKDYKKPSRTPTELTQEQESLLKEGITLHDQGDFEDAIKKYEEILASNPDSVIAIYEISFSYFMKEDFKKSLEFVQKGITYQSKYLPKFYLQMASCMDNLGKPDEALEIYKAALKEYPEQPLLNYNIALTYFQQGKKSQAVSYLKNELFITPGHPTSNLLLGIIFRDTGYNIPAIFALSRFLIIEPRSERASAALESLNQLINYGVKAEGGKNINITVNPDSNKEEGDFDSIQMSLQLVSAARFLDKNKEKSPIENTAEQFRSFFQIMLEMIGSDTKKYKFSGEYYIPYFIDLKKNDHVEAFTYWINSSRNDPDIVNWLQNNVDKVRAFINWNNQYKWPSRD